MSEEKNPWQKRFERERRSRKESEALLEQKSLELWTINQNLEKQVEERTKSLEKALIKAEKADRAKSDFLANMSHEIRTPLNAIIGFSQFLSKSDELNEKNSKYASIVESSANSLLEIINDILDFSKIESGNFDISKNDCNIYDLCKGVFDLFSQKAEDKNIKFIFKMDENIPKYIFSDEVRLRQVLSNLLSNALKFTNNAGEVSFCVDLIKKEEKEILIKFLVQDSGIGIPEDKKEAIFKPFVQLEHIANKQYKGTGLGLSICKNILELMNSKLNVISEQGSGATFSFDLLVEVSKCNVEKQKIEDELCSFSGKILLAEDNLANQELMKLVFSEIEVDFDIASNGLEAFNFYENNPSSYDLVLMDINMPEVDGIQSLFMIRKFEEKKSLTKIPVIALTANAIKGDKEKFLGLGMDDYLAKPLNLDKLKEVISKYLKSEKTIKKQTQKKQGSINIQKISSKLGISENIAQMILSKFKNDIKSDLEELKSLIEDDKKEEIVNKAHYIKNSCLNVCFHEACKILQKMENKELSNEEFKSFYKELEILIITF